MSVKIAVGVGLEEQTESAAIEAAAQAMSALGASCDLCVAFVGAAHVAAADEAHAAIHKVLAPQVLIGCGAGGIVGHEREIENGDGIVVWALSAPDATIRPLELMTQPVEGGIGLGGLPDDPADYGDAMIVLADPSSFSADALLAHLNDARPGLPVLGGLASAGSTCLFLDDEVKLAGAVGCSLSGVEMIPCVSQGAAPVGPEMTVTGAEGNLIQELASKPALERIREVLDDLSDGERDLAAQGLLLGVVIEENQPEYERGDFLVRPIVGVDPATGAVAIADHARVGQIVRLHVRDATLASEDLREALATRALALGDAGAAGALLFTCNGRGRHMFDEPDHDATAVADVLSAPAGGFFAAGEIGPVGGRNFLHGFTATMAVFPRE